MNHADDANENALAGIDLHKWQVPPAPAGQRPLILVRALAPAPVVRRRRTAWMVAAMLILNAAIATIIAIVISRPQPATDVSTQPAGGPLDARVQELLRQLDEQQREIEEQKREIVEKKREIERRLAELEEGRVLLEQLTKKLRSFQERDKRARPAPKQRDPLPADTSCDEVSCVLDNYQAACCAKFRRGTVTSLMLAPPASDLPEGLDRAMITSGIDGVRARIIACRARSLAKGKVKVSVRVNAAGNVTNVSVESTPEPALAACVAAAIQRAKFGQTVNGGSFSYPFIF